MRHASMRRHEHTLYALNQEEIAGSPWIGYCTCGAIFKAPTENERARRVPPTQAGHAEMSTPTPRCSGTRRQPPHDPG